ncbi:hypothetical protein ABZY10_07570 [Streptomyces sp. NPDC006539]|uniref:hypothetical protein n=1 Tax=Streptomyces sp. NPDC006539 TaxID=3155352 RepID=UPI00339E4F72
MTAGVAETGLDQLYRAELHEVTDSAADSSTAGVLGRRILPWFTRERRVVPLLRKTDVNAESEQHGVVVLRGPARSVRSVRTPGPYAGGASAR